MNVLLMEINPFSEENIPISIGYIGAFLKKNGFNVKILNIGENTNLSKLSLYNFISEFKPRLVGISTYQRNILYVIAISKFIKAIDKETKIVLGGPQTTFMPAIALKYMPVDYICRGEGEFTALSIAQAIEGGDPFSNIMGATYKADGEIFDGKPTVLHDDLDLYPSPHLDGIFDYKNIKEAILLTSRGCPFNCIFCYTPHASHHKIRFHSIERVMEEIKWLVKRGINRFWFADPNFSFDIGRVHSLLDKIIESNLKIHMWIETRADFMDKELAKKMKMAGVHTVAYGLESASERVLKIINKGISLKRLEEAIYLTQGYDMDVELFSLFGLPGETMEDALKTIMFVEGHGVKIKGNSNAQQMQLYFGSTITRNYSKYGIRPLKERRPPYLSIGDRYETDAMSYKEILKIKAIWRKRSLDKGKRIVS